MRKSDILGNQYCKTSCPNKAKYCPIAKELGRNYCPKCGTVIRKRDDKGNPIKWDGGDGLIPVAREDRHYTKSYACDCDVGRLRIDQHIRPYIFHGDEVCILERTFQHLQMKWRRNNLNDRPSGIKIEKYNKLNPVAVEETIDNFQKPILEILKRIKEEEQEQTGDDDTPFG